MKIIIKYIIFPIMVFLSCYSTNKTFSGKKDNQLIYNDSLNTVNDNKLWKKSVIHLEGATDSKSWEDRIEQIQKLQEELNKNKITPEEFSNKMLNGYRDIRYFGTAIFIEHEKKRYLCTARHVLYDKVSAKRYLESEKENAESWPKEMRENLINSAKISSETFIFNIIFRIPSFDEIISQPLIKTPEFLMNLGAGPYGIRDYTFSDPEIDLAIISLDEHNSNFANELISKGYIPINFNKIGESPTAEGAEVFTVGYPTTTSILGELKLQPSEKYWGSSFVSIPTFAFGKVSMLNNNLPFFWCDISIYPGNSGGPIVEDNKLVGVISAQPVIEKQRVLFAKIIKAKYVRDLLQIQIMKDKSSF